MYRTALRSSRENNPNDQHFLLYKFWIMRKATHNIRLSVTKARHTLTLRNRLSPKQTTDNSGIYYTPYHIGLYFEGN